MYCDFKYVIMFTVMYRQFNINDIYKKFRTSFRKILRYVLVFKHKHIINVKIQKHTYTYKNVE